MLCKMYPLLGEGTEWCNAAYAKAATKLVTFYEITQLLLLLLLLV